MLRYIFEKKEIKKTESKGKKDEDGESEKVPDHKTIARLQVSVNFFLNIVYPPLQNSRLVNINSFMIFVSLYFLCYFSLLFVCGWVEVKLVVAWHRKLHNLIQGILVYKSGSSDS